MTDWNDFVSRVLNVLLICGLIWAGSLSPGLFLVFAVLGAAWFAFLWLAKHKPIWAAGVLGLLDGIFNNRRRWW